MKIKLAFASGTATLNRAMLDDFDARRPDLPLFVVAEFEPHRGQWIPWHVYRPYAENLTSVKAALADFEIERSAVVFAEGTALGKMRRAAFRIAPQSIAIYNLPEYWNARMRNSLAKPVTRWARLAANPKEAEIRVRARWAQLRGTSAKRRGVAAEPSMPASGPLADGVTVVVPSRDGLELLRAMLPPLAEQVRSGEVIVVDNGSSDGTARLLGSPHVQTIESEEPLSFAKAVNLGIARARFRRTLLLNNDMIVEPGFIAALEQAFTRVPDLYCATAQIFFPEGARREETGKAVWRREGPLDFPVRCDEPYEGEDLTWVLYGSGGCSLFDTAKLRELGGVSETYDPAYVEDLDFGYRAWKRGWATVFCAGARVVHRHRATTSRFFSARQIDFFIERNYLRFLIQAIGSRALFRSLWSEGVRRLQLLAMDGNEAASDTLRDVPAIGPMPPAAAGPLAESEILALCNGDIAAFPGRAPAERKKVVIASPYLPFPLSHGGAVRIFNLMREGARDHDLILIAFCDALATPPRELLDICAEVVLVRRHGSHYRRETEYPDVVMEFESETFRACLKQTCARWKPAAVQLEFTWMAQYAGAYPAAKNILIEHDITFDLQEQLLATSTDTGAVRLELETQTRKWRAFETDAWRRVDAVVTMSGRDRRTVRNAKEIHVLPNGVDCERFQPSAAAPEKGRLLFIGSFAHLPNLLALEFFLREVWPLLPAGFTLHTIAGPRPDYWLEFYRNRVTVDLNRTGIELEGFVADVRGAYRRAELVLAPLTASAGTNIKVLEAMAMGRVVVTTPAGINGLDLKDGSDVVVARSGAEFAGAIQSLSMDGARRTAIEKHARATAVDKFDWGAIGELQRPLWNGDPAGRIRAEAPHRTEALTPHED
ncbi:MAG: glycosyltransferase [Acidobacteriota bacterium]|nr:glycosyltransferase [Acidobacteriota bacterium]